MSSYVPGAIAGAHEGSVEYFLFQENGNITQKTRKQKEADLSAATFVGTAKQGSPVTLVVSGDKQVVLAYAEGDVLQNFVYDDVEDEWAPGTLSSVQLVVRENSKITGTFDSSGQFYVFAAARTGELVVVTANADGVFGPPETLNAARLTEKISIFALLVGDVVHAFYTHQDLSIHRLALVDGAWQDSQVDQTNDGTNKYNVAAVVEPNGGYRLQFTNDNREVLALSSDGTLRRVGDVGDDGQIKPTTEAQAWGGLIVIISW